MNNVCPTIFPFHRHYMVRSTPPFLRQTQESYIIIYSWLVQVSRQIFPCSIPHGCCLIKVYPPSNIPIKYPHVLSSITPFAMDYQFFPLNFTYSNCPIRFSHVISPCFLGYDPFFKQAMKTCLFGQGTKIEPPMLYPQFQWPLHESDLEVHTTHSA